MSGLSTPSYPQRLAALPLADRRLLTTMAAVALVALAVGIGGGLATALARAGFIDVIPATGYRFLTVHGVSIFFYCSWPRRPCCWPSRPPRTARVSLGGAWPGPTLR